MAIVRELEGPVGDVDATVDRKIGSGRALDTAAFRPHAKACAKSSTQAGARPFTAKKADGEAFTGKKAKADGEAFIGKKAKTDGGAFTGKKAKTDGDSFEKTVSAFVIPGLWTPEVAKQKEFDDSINQYMVHLKIKLPTMIDLSIYQTWYLLYGKLNLKDLAARVCYKLNLEMDCPINFVIDSIQLPEVSIISNISKKYESVDGVLHLFCDIAQDPLKHGWVTIERKKKKLAKNASALSKQHTSKKLIMKTGSVVSSIELVAESVPFSKFPSCKTKGSRKMAQFVKKRQMQLVMNQKSPFVQLKDGPAVRSFGTSGPGGNLQFY